MNLLRASSAQLLLAAFPLLLVLYLMIGRRWGGSKAGPAGWLAAVLIAVISFGAGPQLFLVAWGRSLLLALFVLYIIWMALLFYHTVNDAGAIRVLRDELPRFAPDRPAQALLLAWIFGAFLQGASGFGVPAAVVAPLLLGLGFAPNIAVVMALLGHAWAITYGSLGSSFFALMAATGLPGEILQEPVAWMLGLVCFCCGFGVLWACGGWAALRRRWLSLLGLSLLMASVQWGLAWLGLWSLAAFGAGLAGLVAAILIFRRSGTAAGKNQSRAMDSVFTLSATRGHHRPGRVVPGWAALGSGHQLSVPSCKHLARLGNGGRARSLR